MSGTKRVSKEEILYGKVVYENDKYLVQVVKMPDMYFETYGVVNKDTAVIEQIQPILYNAQQIADQLARWLTRGPSEEDIMDSMLLNMGMSGGRAN